VFPLRDKNETDSIPVFTVLIILINCFVFAYEINLSWTSSATFQQFIETWGFVPDSFRTANVRSLLTMFTSMFLHGGYVHLIGNMLFLWVFGDNVEDELGHFNFLLFYLGAGLAGVFGQYLVTPHSSAPLIGASGAIAGVLGAYMLFFPTAKVLTAVIFIIIVRFIYLPAWILLGFWLFLQLLQGTASLGVNSAGGVAWFAHIGGFVAGFIVSFIVKARKLSRRDP
jgi:membrane associated rhomboid family serine protease